MAWSYYSEKNGKKINVDMLKLARMVESLTGEKDGLGSKNTIIMIWQIKKILV